MVSATNRLPAVVWPGFYDDSHGECFLRCFYPNLSSKEPKLVQQSVSMHERRPGYVALWDDQYTEKHHGRALSQSTTEPQPSPQRVLTLFDCICIIVGTIIGSGIFILPGAIASNVPNIYWLAGVWVFGGVVALIGALCFAELTTTYPDSGGDYGYLKRAYGRRVGFAFSWAAFWVIRPANIGAMAMAFGEFGAKTIPTSMPIWWYAVIAIIVMSVTNLMGVTFGKTVQNFLTVAKVLGMLLIVVAAFVFGSEQDPSLVAPLAAQGTESPQSLWSGFWLAMVFVMFAFGGWNDIAFVASEAKEPKRNLLRSLVLGTTVVVLVYLLVNFSLLYGLGFERMSTLGSQWGNATSVLVAENIGSVGSRLFNILVCISCLGAINAMIFTSPRIYWATADDYPGLQWMAGSKEGRGWWRAMLLQSIVTLVLIYVFGRIDDGVANLVAASAPYFWFFLGIAVVSLMVCRVRFKGQFGGYRIPLYPVLPLVFLAACVFMIYRSLLYMHEQELAGPTIWIGIWVIAGILLSFTLKSHIETDRPQKPIGDIS